jgi:simple sugar transport system substrate-binding protein
MKPGLFRKVTVALAAFLLAGTVAHAQEKLRFLLVTHGAAADPFWGQIKDGAEAAARDAGVTVEYRAPETFDLAKMTALLEAAVKDAPDGLVVSIPNADAVAAPIQEAVAAGIPVITINSGFDVSRSLGALLHVGQGEYEAGRVAGDTMRQLGGTKALCLNHEVGNVGLDLRCKGFIDGFAGSVEVLPIGSDATKAEETLTARLKEDERIDSILALSATIAAGPAVAAAQTVEGREVRVATFDVTDAMLAAVADGKAVFAIDQQPFLQGYLPVEFLTLLKRRNVVPVSNVSTGPRLITMKEAQRMLGRPVTETPAAGGATTGDAAKDGAGTPQTGG